MIKQKKLPSSKADETPLGIRRYAVNVRLERIGIVVLSEYHNDIKYIRWQSLSMQHSGGNQLCRCILHNYQRIRYIQSMRIYAQFAQLYDGSPFIRFDFPAILPQKPPKHIVPEAFGK